MKFYQNIGSLVHIYKLMEWFNYSMCLFQILWRSKRSVKGNNSSNSIDKIEYNETQLMAAFQQFHVTKYYSLQETIISSCPKWSDWDRSEHNIK